MDISELKEATKQAVEALSEIFESTKEQVEGTIGRTTEENKAREASEHVRAILMQAYVQAVSSAVSSAGVTAAKALFPPTAEEEMATAERIRAEAERDHQQRVDDLAETRFYDEQIRRIYGS